MSTDKVESLTASAARIRKLEEQLEVADRTNAALRNILVTPVSLGPDLLAAEGEHKLTDPELRRWLAALPDAIDALPPATHRSTSSKAVLPS